MYDFSVDELLVLCQVAKVNVAIFEQRADTLFYQGGCSRFSGPVILTKLSVGGAKRVRSHFERLVLDSEFSNVQAQAAKIVEERVAAAEKQKKEQEEQFRRQLQQERLAREAAKPIQDVLPPPPPHPFATGDAERRRLIKRLPHERSFGASNTQHCSEALPTKSNTQLLLETQKRDA